jgi:hypothetical protein
MSFTLLLMLSCAALFIVMLVLFEVGRRIGQARSFRDPDGVGKGSGPVEAAILGLLGLLLAFTFSGAGERFEARRHLIGEETNAIGTAYARLDLLPADSQPVIQQLFRRYIDVRAGTYRNAEDAAATARRLEEAASLQRDIWKHAVVACQQAGAPPQAAMLLLPALNAMIDITTTRAVAMHNHPPRVIFLLLSGLSLLCSTMIGYVTCATKVRSWFYMLLFAAAMSLTLYVILDLEYPRYGLIRVDAADQPLLDLLGSLR